ncbi:hypothetical protein HA052_19625 [Chromobacterium haemolyticum]|uniref:Uncharacterized protein n=1 Tax=Chromobacterium fluminis TaxID=3044269 RepID=A0ABX0L6G5_9NEIS|nr:hypothetical protein [Chromobacterium haemolyticum]NHR07404.1 hypothetical protein [Chromobacterium haemolyticum]
MRDRHNLGIEGLLGLLACIAVLMINYVTLPGLLAKILASYATLCGLLIAVLHFFEIGSGRTWPGGFLPLALAIWAVKLLLQ